MPTLPDVEDYNQNDNPGTEETINPYKIVNYAQLDDNLTAVANAIRAKGGTSAQLSFPAGMAQAIADLPSGGGEVDYLTVSDGKICVIYEEESE